MLAPAPAPLSTARLAPRPMNFLTVSGVAATRRSPASPSLSTAIFTPQPPPVSVRDDQDNEQCRDRADDRAIFHQADEHMIGVGVETVGPVGLFGSHMNSPCKLLFRSSLTKAARLGARLK